MRPRLSHSPLRSLRALGLLVLLSVVPLAAFGQGQPFVGTGHLTLAANPTSVSTGDHLNVTLAIDVSMVTGQSPSMTPTPFVVSGYVIDIVFDPSRIQYDSVAPPSGGGTLFPTAPGATSAAMANATGKVTISASQVSSSSSPTGVITVAVASFTALTAGNTTLTGSINLSSAFQGPGFGPAPFAAAGSNAGIQIADANQPPLPPYNPIPNDGNTSAPVPTTLSWSAPGADSSDVYFGSTTTVPLVASVSQPPVTVPTQPASKYYWQVVSKYSGQSATGPLWSFTTVAQQGCVAPLPATLNSPNAVDSRVTYQVYWATVADATDYKLEESTDPNFSFSTVRNLTFAATDSNFSHTVPVDTRYYYRITPRNASTGCNLSAPASATRSVLVRADAGPHTTVVAVAGSTPGASGSFFTTTLQIQNPTAANLTGKVVYHPAGLAGASDPSVVFSLPPAGTQSIDVSKLFGPSGTVGSLDVVTNEDWPVVAARIFDDKGAAGTSGMNVEAVRSYGVMAAGDTGVIVAPPDSSRARMNIGVRTLGAGATIRYVLHGPDGSQLNDVSAQYGPTFFSQTPAGSLLGTIPSGGSVTVTVLSGSALVYGSITDNTTNDPAMQLLKHTN